MPGRGWLTLCGLLLVAPPARADLFACREIVTGTDIASHPEALAQCVRDVVVKVTGQPAHADDPRVAAIAGRAATLVEDVAYLDRMSDIPHHDEQGTRDRPYDLIAHLDPDRVGAELHAVGLTPWLSRPALLVLVSVRRDDAGFMLDADGDAGERQRQALLAAGERFGLRAVLPTRAQLGTGQMPAVRGGTVRLRGELVWSPLEFGWTGRWRLDDEASWEIGGVSFDDAFRSGVGGAAERLSRR